MLLGFLASEFAPAIFDATNLVRVSRCYLLLSRDTGGRIVRIIHSFNREGVQSRTRFRHVGCAKLRSEDSERGELNENAGFRLQGEPLVSTQEPEPGDEVVLRTGGPLMTVLGSADDHPRELLCVWFDEQRRRCQGTFHSQLLKLVE